MLYCFNLQTLGNYTHNTISSYRAAIDAGTPPDEAQSVALRQMLHIIAIEAQRMGTAHVLVTNRAIMIREGANDNAK